MNERDWLAERFEARWARSREVAYRMRGALSEADDGVSEAWLRLSSAGIRPTQQNADKSSACARAPSAFAPPSASGTEFPSPQV
jgi:DNA-directed RNA polymerase specialized sigma24 family protein